jgi:ribosomal protein L31
MKKALHLAVFVLTIFFLTSCGKTTTINSNMELTGKWQLESIVQEDDTIEKPPLQKGAFEVSLNFKEKGELEGTSSTNYLTGFN